MAKLSDVSKLNSDSLYAIESKYSLSQEMIQEQYSKILNLYILHNLRSNLETPSICDEITKISKCLKVINLKEQATACISLLFMEVSSDKTIQKENFFLKLDAIHNIMRYFNLSISDISIDTRMSTFEKITQYHNHELWIDREDLDKIKLYSNHLDLIKEESIDSYLQEQEELLDLCKLPLAPLDSETHPLHDDVYWYETDCTLERFIDEEETIGYETNSLSVEVIDGFWIGESESRPITEHRFGLEEVDSGNVYFCHDHIYFDGDNKDWTIYYNKIRCCYGAKTHIQLEMRNGLELYIDIGKPINEALIILRKLINQQ